jgi:hypothetical protein
MIITKTEPFTRSELKELAEQFEIYIKTVIDIKQKICTAGMDRHFEGEQILLAGGSKQADLWGGGISLETKEIDFNSFINIRPRENNPKNEILDPQSREVYETLTKYFFQKLYD